ncbi:MAG: nickel-responsive transcriptional regulator NikR [Novosphingobium sp.]
MQRVTISLDEPLGQTLDREVRARNYPSRSEAVRDLVREGLERWRDEHVGGERCVANLSYIVDNRVRALPQRIAAMQHAHHDLIVASTIARLDHFHSLESVILKGTTAAVRAFADSVRGERGVKFGAINLLQVTTADQHGPADHHHEPHAHLAPVG